MKTVQGDLLQLALMAEFDVIVHGCNCFCTMGAGIAKSIKDKFPEAFAADLNSGASRKSVLGTISIAHITRGPISFIVVNAYTQFDYRGPGRHADYDAIRSAFRLIKKSFSGRRIGYPKIGAGLAGGDWKIISAIINEELAGEEHVFVEYVP